MKRVSIILALLVFILTGCSGIFEDGYERGVEIELKAGFSGFKAVDTKTMSHTGTVGSVAEGFDKETIIATVVGWETDAAPTSSDPISWESDFQDYVSVLRSAENTAKTFKLSPTRYYRFSGANTYFKAFHPSITAMGSYIDRDSGEVDFSEYFANGDKDLLYTPAYLSGNRGNTIYTPGDTDPDKRLKFEHKLAQIFFTLIDDTDPNDRTSKLGDHSWVLGVSGIGISNIKYPKSMNLFTGNITASDPDISYISLDGRNYFDFGNNGSPNVGFGAGNGYPTGSIYRTYDVQKWGASTQMEDGINPDYYYCTVDDPLQSMTPYMYVDANERMFGYPVMFVPGSYALTVNVTYVQVEKNGEVGSGNISETITVNPPAGGWMAGNIYKLKIRSYDYCTLEVLVEPNGGSGYIVKNWSPVTVIPIPAENITIVP